MKPKILEYIEFNSFNSKELNLYLTERNAPTPAEKEIIENIPYMQGVLDFSAIFGERKFENREISYTFISFDNHYNKRKKLEQQIKQKLMLNGESRLYDSHDDGFFWLGKCKKVTVENDNVFNRLIVDIVFDCYPFMFSMNEYFSDIWDVFDFDNDVASYTKFNVSGMANIRLLNYGERIVTPTIITTSDFVVTTENGEVFNFSKGTNEDFLLTLGVGVNSLKIEGTGTIAFHFNCEVMG